MNVVNEVFDKVTVVALEDWGMMLVEPVEVSRQIFEDQDHLFIGSTQFRGVMNGTIVVLCSKEFMNAICRNLLALPPEYDVTEDQCEDGLKELINVFCGNFLTEAYGDDTVFELVYPAVKVATDDEIENFWSSRLVHCFIADSEPIAVALTGLEVGEICP